MKNSNIKSVSIRIPDELLQKLHYVADYDGRSVNSQVLHLIRERVKSFEDDHGKIRCRVYSHDT